MTSSFVMSKMTCVAITSSFIGISHWRVQMRVCRDPVGVHFFSPSTIAIANVGGSSCVN